jgi:hypothetical protein
MKLVMRILLINCSLGLLSCSILGQTPFPGPTPVQEAKTSGDISRENWEKAKEDEWAQKNKKVGLPKDPNIPNVIPTAPTRPTAIQPSKKQAVRLRPAAQDLNLYADFLKQSNTGLIRLFPEIDCGGQYVVHAEGPCADEIPLSSFYSFRKKNYSERGLSDLGLKGGFLFNDAWLSNGIIVKLGDIPLESIAVDSEGIKFLADYAPATDKDEILTKSGEMIKGLNVGNYFYSKAVRAEEKTTYALRMIAYRGKVLRPLEKNIFKDELEGDKRVDLVVAFRVVRKEADGNLTLLWKQLQRKDSPKIKN